MVKGCWGVLAAGLYAAASWCGGRYLLHSNFKPSKCVQSVWLNKVAAVSLVHAVQSAADLAADLARKVPTKIDIGPVYTHDPRQRAKYAKGERSHSSTGHAES